MFLGTFFFYNRELSLRKGDTVYLLCRVDKNWFEGERNGMVGIFPVNYVEVDFSRDFNIGHLFLHSKFHISL